MKLALLLLLMTLSFSSKAVILQMTEKQKKTIRGIVTKVQQGKKKEALNSITPYLNKTLAKKSISVGNLPFLQELINLGFIISREAYWPGIKTTLKINKDLNKNRHKQQAVYFQEFIVEAVESYKYHYVNIMILAKKIKIVRDANWFNHYVEVETKPMKIAVNNGSRIRPETFKSVRVFGKWAGLLFDDSDDSFPDFEAALFDLYIEANSTLQKDNARQLLGLLLDVSPKGIRRFNALRKLWKSARSEGNIKLALGYLNCNDVERMTAKPINKTVKADLELQCISLYARTLNYSYSTDGIKEFIDSTTSKYKFTESEARPGAIELISSLIALNRRIGQLDKIEPLLKVINAASINQTNFYSTYCDSVVRYQSLKGEQSKLISNCIRNISEGARQAIKYISNFAFIYVEISRYYRTIGDNQKSSDYAKKAMKAAEKNRPNRGYFKFEVFLNQLQDRIANKDMVQASRVHKKIEALLENNPFGLKLSPLVKAHKGLLNGDLKGPEFLKQVKRNYPSDALIQFDAAALAKVVQ